ncbi:MAG: PQQ-dependent sugar dehydrogenase [Candidatus Limnocylindria bacterium]
MLPPRSAVVLIMIVLLAACAGPDPSPSVSSEPSAAAPSAPEPASTATVPAPPSSDAPSATPEPIATDPPPLALQGVAEGLAAPIGVATGPAGWLLVQEQDGRVIALETATGAMTVALDITDRVFGGGERGLLGLALHPGFPDDARAFVHYSDRDGNTVLSEFDATETSGPIVIDPTTERVLLQVAQPFANHNGGQLAFGPDGYLWLGLGDGGSGGDPLGHGQNPATLLGTILRLDVGALGGYAVPSDNPYADGGGAPEVYLYGLRNPWRFSFDRGTGQLWVADVGQNAYEEINRLDPIADAGANLGWSIMEATHCFTDPACSSEGLVLPIAEYGHDVGCSVTGGHVYRGDAIPALTGWYVFADYCSGLVFGLASDAGVPADGSALSPRVLLDADTSVSSFGEGADGELYLADLASGTIYRIVAGG